MAIRPIDNDDPVVAQRIVAVQRAAYAVEAELMSFDGIRPLRENAAEVQSHDKLAWLGAFSGEELAGIIAWRHHGDSIQIDRLAIDPKWSRRGFGRALVQVIPDTNLVEVSTGSANHPAIALYQGEGFRFIGRTEIAPQVFTSQFRRVTPRRSESP